MYPQRISPYCDRMGLDTVIGVAVVIATGVFVCVFWMMSQVEKMKEAEEIKKAVADKPLPPPQT